MKKIIILSTLVLIGSTQCMYHNSKRKLKYDEVTLTNNSSILLELVWVEVSQGRQEKISHAIKPDETITVKIGEIGNYLPNYGGAKIVYTPIKDDPNFKQNFTIDLPNSPTFVFTVKNTCRCYE